MLYLKTENKSEIVSAINGLQLSCKTVTRRVESVGKNLVRYSVYTVYSVYIWKDNNSYIIQF